MMLIAERFYPVESPSFGLLHFLLEEITCSSLYG